MNAVDYEGFNSFRRWPSSSMVSLSEQAKIAFELDTEVEELTFDAIRSNSKFDDAVMDRLLDARPMADQRGEKVMLDVDSMGSLVWSKVVS